MFVLKSVYNKSYLLMQLSKYSPYFAFTEFIFDIRKCTRHPKRGNSSNNHETIQKLQLLALFQLNYQFKIYFMKIILLKVHSGKKNDTIQCGERLLADDSDKLREIFYILIKTKLILQNPLLF